MGGGSSSGEKETRQQEIPKDNELQAEPAEGGERSDTADWQVEKTSTISGGSGEAAVGSGRRGSDIINRCCCTSLMSGKNQGGVAPCLVFTVCFPIPACFAVINLVRVTN